MVGSGEGYVISEEAGELSCEGRGELRTPIRDYLGMETEPRENIGEEKLATPSESMFFVQGQ